MFKKHPKIEFILSIIYTLFIAFFIRTIVFEPFSIPTGSMKPNFWVGDYLFVSKYPYGISNASLLFEPNLIKDRIFEIEQPKRGEVIVFKSPHDRYTNYIKRLIGLPGDEIQVKEGILYINGKMAPRKEVGKFTDPDNGEVLNKYIETLPNGISYYVIESDKGSLVDNTPLYKVPAGHYFMMGDNRDHSADSRYGDYPIGFVAHDKLIGRAEMIIFSNPVSIINLPKWVLNFYGDRFFKRIKPLDQ